MKTEYRGYKPGDRVELISMYGEESMPSGLKGTIREIDDMGQLHTSWENKRSLAINLDGDKIKKNQ